MRIQTLVENTTLSEDFACEHGLSLFIEAKGEKILFDVGASDLFLKNAEKLGVNLSDVDLLIISHAHGDHGGGLEAFLKANKKAKVYVHRSAFDAYYSARSKDELTYIGLDEKLKENERLIFTENNFRIKDNIRLFSNVLQKGSLPRSNRTLFMKREGRILPDCFEHEQNLILEEEGKTLLVTGCAHNGIINILEHFRVLEGRVPDYVIGGFHLSSRSDGDEEEESIDQIGRYLLESGAQYYTCHCTGWGPYQRLKTKMGNRIDYLSSGTKRVIE